MLFFLLLSAALGAQSLKILNVTLAVPWTSRLVDFPPSPICTRTSLDRISHKEGIASVWEIDPTLAIGSGTIHMREEIKTECSINFFGGTERLVLSRISKVSLTTCQPSENKDPQFICSWMATNQQKSTVCNHVKVDIYLNAEGGLWANGKIWKQEDSQRYRAGSDLLEINSMNTVCPLRLWVSGPAIISNSSIGPTLISIPSHDQMYSLASDKPHRCAQKKTPLLMTKSGYLISFNYKSLNASDGKGFINWLKFSPKNKLLPHVNYEMHEMTLSYDRLLELIYHDMCLRQQTEWKSLTSNPSPHKVAAYYTGDPYAFGEDHDGRTQIFGLKLSQLLVPESSVSFGKNRLIKIINGSTTREIEPLSGLIQLNESRWLNQIPLLRLANDGFYNLYTKEVVYANHEQLVNRSSGHFIDIPEDHDAIFIRPNIVKPNDDFTTLNIELSSQISEWFSNLTSPVKTVLSLILIAFVLYLFFKIYTILKPKCLKKRQPREFLSKV